VVAAHDETYGLSRLDFGEGGSLWVPDTGAAIGSSLRLRIRARDVSLAREKPAEISVLNNLPARIVAIHPAEGPYRDVEMQTAGVPLWARITARSVAELRLAIGERSMPWSRPSASTARPSRRAHPWQRRSQRRPISVRSGASRWRA
jgi:ABC-type molybdate transport system, ATPase component